MKLQFKTLSRATFTIEAEPSEKVKKKKNTIFIKFYGSLLKKKKKKKKKIAKIAKIKINIYYLNIYIYILSIFFIIKVIDLKKKVSEVQGFDVDRQNLIYKGI